MAQGTINVPGRTVALAYLAYVTGKSGKKVIPTKLAASRELMTRAALSEKELDAAGRQMERLFDAAARAQILEHFIRDGGEDLHALKSAVVGGEVDLVAATEALSKQAKDLGLSFTKVGNFGSLSAPITGVQYKEGSAVNGIPEVKVAGEDQGTGVRADKPTGGVTVTSAKTFCQNLGPKYKLPSFKALVAAQRQGLFADVDTGGRSIYLMSSQTKTIGGRKYRVCLDLSSSLGKPSYIPEGSVANNIGFAVLMTA